MLTKEQVQMLHEAELVLIEEEVGIVWVWYGGQYVNRFMDNGELIHSWCRGDLSEGRQIPTKQEARELIEEDIAEMKRELNL
jgi:hypothetical protein